MAIKGSLREAGLAEVCQLLAHSGKSGCLSATDKSRFGQIYFERGAVIYATILNRRDRLGDLLVRDGVLTAGSLQEVVQAQAHEPDRRLGELLLERQLLTETELEKYIRLQIKEAVYELFMWSRGKFFFQVGERPPVGTLTVSFSPEALLLEAARRTDEWEQIKQKIPSLDLVFVADDRRLRSVDVSLTSEQEAVITLLDGTRSVSQLVEETGLPEFEVGCALYGLVLAGLIRQAGRRHADHGPAQECMYEQRNLGMAFSRAGMLDDALEAFRRVLELRPEDASARFQLAVLLLRQGKNAHAEAVLRSMLEVGGRRYAVLVNLAVALLRAGRPHDAASVLDEAEEVRPGRCEVSLLRSSICLALCDLEGADAALGQYRRRLTQDPPPAAYYHNAGLRAALAGELDGAVNVIREGLALYPTSAPLFVLAGAVTERRGELQIAERYYCSSVEEEPGLALGHKNLGDLAYVQGLSDEAYERYERAVRLRPDLGDEVFTRLGDVAFKRGQNERAFRCWQRALELNPANSDARRSLNAMVDASG